ncbi:hypothetical protein R50072_35000 [Simiduia litorea]|uniref:DUF3094 family protein n=1 Tax=Simiduia litorea TaxID=1435348 RepID=UPI0036F3DB4A
MTSHLSPEDQAKVDSVIHSGCNDTERAPFRPWLLLGIILLTLTVLSVISYFLAWQQGAV